MKKRRAAFTSYYFIIAAIEILVATIGKRGWVYVFKPALMVSLFLWAYFSPDLRPVKAKGVFLAGMVFACAGDTFLMFSDDWFMPGLGAFLVMQWLYSWVFYQESSFAPTSGYFWGILAVLLLIVVGLSFTILSALTDPVLSGAVTIYSVSIATMVLLACFRKGNVPSVSFRLVTLGAFLFLVSDSLLAVNKFVLPVSNSTFWVMSTYATAQYCIVVGMLRGFKKPYPVI